MNRTIPTQPALKVPSVSRPKPSVTLLVAALNRPQAQRSVMKTEAMEVGVAAVPCHNKIVKSSEVLWAALLVLLSFCF